MARARGLIAAAAFAGVVVTGGVAWAQPKTPPPAAPPAAGSTSTAAKPADPRKAYADGEKKFKANDFQGALLDFQAADSVKQTPQAARYIGLCQDNLGHLPEAVAAYERFLAAVPANMKDQEAEVKRRVEAIKATPGKLHVETTPAGAKVSIDGKPADGATPLDTDVAPGHHTVELSAEGRITQQKEIDVTYASKQEVKADLEEKPAAPPPPPPPPPPVAATPPPPPPTQATEPKGSSTVPALITGGLAVVALGVGTVFGVMALQDKSDFDKNPTSSKADDGENHALIADMAFGVAVTLGVTSAVLFFSGGSSGGSAKANAPPTVAKKAPSKDFSVAPIVTPHGGGAGATLRF